MHGCRRHTDTRGGAEAASDDTDRHEHDQRAGDPTRLCGDRAELLLGIHEVVTPRAVRPAGRRAATARGPVWLEHAAALPRLSGARPSGRRERVDAHHSRLLARSARGAQVATSRHARGVDDRALGTRISPRGDRRASPRRAPEQTPRASRRPWRAPRPAARRPCRPPRSPCYGERPYAPVDRGT
jgi:hypothetical protein